MFINKHPLTDEMIEDILFNRYWWEIEPCQDALRDAYDLAWKNAKDQDKAYIRQSYNQGYNDAKKEIKSVLSHMKQLEEL